MDNGFSLFFFNNLIKSKKKKTKIPLSLIYDNEKPLVSNQELNENGYCKLSQNLNAEILETKTALNQERDSTQISALNLKVQRLETQLGQTQKKYNDHIKTLPEINIENPPKGFNNLVWLAQPVHATLPLNPQVAWKHLLSLFIWAGFIFGIIAIIMKRLLSSGLYSNTDITKRSGLRVMGRMPNFGPLSWEHGQWHRNKLPNVLPIDYTEITRLQQILMGGKSGSLAITATQTGEGNSLLSYLLASRSAQDGKRILLIDLNLKNQTLTQRIGQKAQVWNLPNLTDLSHISELAIQTIPNLFILPAPSDSTSVKWLGETTNMEFLLSTLKSKYDWIIIDTTPLTVKNRNNVDPMLVAAVANHTMVTFLAGETSKTKFSLAMRDLLATGANVSGVAVNDHKNPAVKDTLMALANTVKPLLPGLSSWLMHRAR